MINLEKEIREQPKVLESVIENNIETVEAIVREAKEKNLTNILIGL